MARRIRKILTIITSTLTLAAQPALAQDSLFPFMVESRGLKSASISDSVFYNIAASVVFPIRKTEIDPNSAFYRQLTEQVIPWLKAKNYTVERIIMRGAASPDGPYDRNVRLGRGRLQALYDLLRDNMQMPDCEDCLRTVEEPEDYTYLLIAMKKAGDKDYELVRDIYERYRHDSNPYKLKYALINHDRRVLWNRLNKEYFPYLRSARVVFLIAPLNPEAQEGLQTLQPERAQTPLRLQTTPYTLPSLPYYHYQQPQMKEPDILPRREFMSVKTNLLYDFAYMPGGYNRFCPIPNIAVEFFPKHGHFTYGASFDCPWWGDYWAHKYFQVRNYQLEARYYLRSGDINRNPPGMGAAFKGFYAQAYIQAGLYSISFTNDRAWMGEGIGGGLGIGYSLPLSKKEHWRLEFSAQFGVFWTKYDPYQWECFVDPTEGDKIYYYKTVEDASTFVKRRHRFTWFGPTRVGITLSYDLLYWRNKKKGVSFLSTEKGGDR